MSEELDSLIAKIRDRDIKQMEHINKLEKENQTLRLHNTRHKLVLENKLGRQNKKVKELTALYKNYCMDQGLDELDQILKETK